MQLLRQTQFVLFGMKHYIKRKKPFPPLEGSLQNKHIIITGATSGLGLGLSKDFAKRGAIVHMVCRNKVKGQTVKQQVIKESNNNNIHLHSCDIAEMKEIKKFVEQYQNEFKELHILVNNAGAMVNTYQKSSEGIQKNFAGNTLGTYYLTKLFIPTLKKTGKSKVITVSSGGMLTQNLKLEDYQMKNSKFDGTSQYAINKRHQVVITQYFSNLYSKQGIFFYSMHPGWVDTEGVRSSMPSFHERFKNDLRSIEQGIDTMVYLSLTPDEKLKKGQFYFDREVEQKHLFISMTKYNQQKIDKLIKDLEEYLAKIN